MIIIKNNNLHIIEPHLFVFFRNRPRVFGLKHIMATGIARITHTPSSVLRHHYADLHKVISQSKETRISLANRFFQSHLIDFNVLSSITTDSDGVAGAQTLLGHLCMKVEQSSDYLPGVIDILGCEVSLIDIVEKMNVFRRDASLSPTDVTITSKHCYLLHVIGGGSSLSSEGNLNSIQIRIFTLTSLCMFDLHVLYFQSRKISCVHMYEHIYN